MADEATAFRLPKSSYDELVKIVQAYGNAGQDAVNLDEVAQVSAMDKTIISRNNAFLVSIGIIEGGQRKGITPKGRSLAQALQYNVLDEISSYWRDLVVANEFLQKMVSAVTIRGGMEDSALQSHIAYSAGESKSAHVMAGAGAVVQILKVAGLVKEQDGKLVAEPSQGISSISLRGTIREPAKPTPPNPQMPVELPAPSGLGLSIQIQIQCTAAEIGELGPKLRALMKELREDTKAES